MKKINISLEFGREIHGELKEENERYYQILVDKTTVPDDLEKWRKRFDWKKGDLIKVSKSLVKQVK